MNEANYTSQLSTGLGMIEETQILMNLWQQGMDSVKLQKIALESGLLPNVSARRLKNIISECFSSRFLHGTPQPAIIIKYIQRALKAREFEQVLFIYTCRANLILADFIREVYWNAYSAGRDSLSSDEAENFIIRANQDGKMRASWSETTIRRQAGYLTGCCADFKLLENGQKTLRKILPFKLESRLVVLLAYDLHFAGHGDNSILNHPDWSLFGMDRNDVLNEFKRLALKGWFIVQAAGDAVRIGWQYQTREEFMDAFIKG